LDCVVAIGVVNADTSKTWIGTGFLVGRFDKKIDDSRNNYHIFLVTNKHVLQGQKSIIVRFNPEPSATGMALDYTIELDEGKTTWAGHPRAEIDVSAISINPSVLKEHSRRFAYFHSDANILCIKDMVEQKVSEGDFIYALEDFD
jgi:hypothetical protein